MLVLGRYAGESIVIGRDREIVLKIIEIRGDHARIGIEAPRDVPIHRTPPQVATLLPKGEDSK